MRNFKKLSRLDRLLTTSLFAILLVGCQTTGSGGIDGKAMAGIVGFCESAEPIYWSKTDSPETVRQAKEHNAVGIALCGWGRNGRSGEKTAPT